MKNIHVLIVCETSLAVKSACPVLSRMKKVTALWLCMLLKSGCPVIFWLQKSSCPVIFGIKIGKRSVIYGDKKFTTPLPHCPAPVSVNFAPSLSLTLSYVLLSS